LDTGPLVAYLNRHDRHHRWAVRCWRSLVDPLRTCEAVISEAHFLLQADGGTPDPLLHLVERGLVRVEFAMGDHQADVFRLLRKHADQGMSVADACLVRMAELADASQVFTTDRDFLVYRRKGRQLIPLMAPFVTSSARRRS
jgi:predicted nucleic acid-binding protein